MNKIDDYKNHVSACIVIPTYNESGNISKLLDGIYDPVQRVNMRRKGISLSVLVVDDSSPDKTADVVRRYQKENSNVHLLLREKKNGLGAAYIAGMQFASIMLKPDIIFEMDADLSHDPSYIIPMIEEIRGGADFVIGSRYIKGGSIPKQWGAGRKLISKSANTYARVVLGILKVRDCTGGFRAIRASILERIDLESLNVKGYAFQISLLNAAKALGAQIKEVPIDFHDRTIGESKMGMSDILEVGTEVLAMGFLNILGTNRAVTTEPVTYRATKTTRGVVKT